ncbi:hypothetical protein GTY77_18165 [Streptomyces sp. SID8380]|nr:hypothetical protein [Streptomyces sp. SID8380]
METIRQLQSWRLDPGGIEDGASFYTIEEDGIQTEIKADNMFGEDAWLLNDTFLALEYYHQQYAAEKERGDGLQEELDDLSYKYDDLSEHSLKRKFELAEEKERANMAYLAYKGLAEDHVSRGEYESLLDKHTAMTKAYRAEKERADKSEEREKVLKHAFIVMMGYVPKTARVALDFDEVLASLYSKEEEAK